MSDQPPLKKPVRYGSYVWIAALSAVAAFAAVYVTSGAPDNQQPATSGAPLPLTNWISGMGSGVGLNTNVVIAPVASGLAPLFACVSGAPEVAGC